ncbi:MAG: ASCH domain-containing protein [Pyrinomonadaceae bacterium]
MSKTVEQFWSCFLEKNPEIAASTSYQVWYFSNNSESARCLAELVISGKKTATASLKAVNDLEPEKAPHDGGYSVVTSFEGEPLCIVRTTEIRHLPFNEVDAQFAYDEGEGDQTLEDWQEGHWAYFVKEAAHYGIEFDETSIVCCERFDLLHPTNAA